MNNEFTDIDKTGKRYRFNTHLPIVGDEEGVLLTSYQASSEHTAKRIFETLGDASMLEICCGVGGSTIFFAKQLSTIYAVDTNPLRIEAAKINANTFGVLDNITFYQADGMDDSFLESLSDKNIQVVFTDVEWRDDLNKTLLETTPDINATIPPTPPLFEKLNKYIGKNIVMHMAANTNKDQLLELGSCEIEEIYFEGKLKFINVYFGDLIKQVGVTRFDMS